jgi:tyrosinase
MRMRSLTIRFMKPPMITTTVYHFPYYYLRMCSVIFLLWIVLADLYPVPSALAQQQNVLICEGTRQRRAWRDLSSPKQQEFLAAIRTLKENGSYDDFTWTHINNHRFSHGTPEFLPWHRWFIHVFETQLMTAANDCTMTLPYWDWELDTLNETTASIMDSFGRGSFFIGAASMSDPNISQLQRQSGCNWPILSERGIWEGCLERDYDERFQYWGEAQIYAMIADYPQFGDDFAAANGGIPENGAEIGVTPDDPHNNSWMEGINGFRIIFEGGSHAAVHNFLGGTMPGMMSPNDPLFYLHHANVDRIWALWQDYHGHSWSMANDDVFLENYNTTTDLSMYEGPNLDFIMPFEREEVQVDFAWLDGSEEFPTARQVLNLHDTDFGMQVQYVHRGSRHPIPGHWCPHPDWFQTEEEASDTQQSSTISLPNLPSFHECKLMQEEDADDENDRRNRRLKSITSSTVEKFHQRQEFLLRKSRQRQQQQQQQQQQIEVELATDLSILYCQTEWNTFEQKRARDRWNRLCEEMPETATIAERLTIMALQDCEERGNPLSASHTWVENLVSNVQEQKGEEQNGISLVQAEMALQCFHVPDEFNR